MGNEKSSIKDYSIESVRKRLDMMTKDIVIGLEQRSRFLQNSSIYYPDAIPIKDRAGISLLEFSIEGLEKYHASLGRYAYEDQNPVVLDAKNSEIVLVDFIEKYEKSLKSPPVKNVSLDIKVSQDILSFYANFIRLLCIPGEDKTCFGETAYCDANIVETVNERVNLGKYVANAKLEKNPQLLGMTEKDLIEKLRSPEREAEMLENVRILSAKYGTNKNLADMFFKWIIDETLKVEADYVGKIGKR
jgi:chorismate mutase